MPRKLSESKKQLLEEIYKEYINSPDASYYELSIKYDVPYSTLRRYILLKLEENGLENEKKTEEFPYEGFECMQPGDTFSWFPGGTIFRALRTEKIAGEKVWIFAKANVKAERHFYPETLDSCKE